MNGVYEAAAEIQAFCERRGWNFCIIGGLALIRWGQVRQTQDVDLTLLTQFDDEPFILDLLASFRARYEGAREFALRNRILLLFASNNVPMDISLGGLPFEEGMIHRATSFEYLPGVTIRTASADDIIISKCFAGRTQDWADVESVLTRQRGRLQWDLILRELTFLCELKETPETVDKLLELKDRYYAE